MNDGVNGVALGVFIFFFLAVTVMGFLAARWRRAESDSLDEWGLGGRSFGTWVTWFLLGGDLYTAYTFVAVPAAIYAAGAAGFFAVPYTILVYPLIFTFLPRLWSVSHKHGYVTTSDFVRGRWGSKGLSLAVAVTGILATMPYIALQLVGIQAVLDVMGVGGGETTNWFVKDLPLLIAFGVLAAYVLLRAEGPRADRLRQGHADLHRHRGGDHLHPDQARRLRRDLRQGGRRAGADQPGDGQATGRAGTGGGGPVGLRHAGTGVRPCAVHVSALDHGDALLAQPRRDPAQHHDSAAVLTDAGPAGAARLHGDRGGREGEERSAGHPAAVREHVPRLVRRCRLRGDRHRGAGAMAIMSIAAANLFTRNIYKDFIKPDATPAQETKVSKLVSLLVKVGALAFVLTMDKTVAINFQLLGGIWILQTFPSLVGGLFTRWFHRWALLAGWAVGMIYGTAAAYGVASPTQKHFGGSSAEIPGFGEIGYIGLTAFVLNVVVTVVLTFVLRALKAPEGVDETSPSDYTADAGDPGVKAELPSATAGAGH